MIGACFLRKRFVWAGKVSSHFFAAAGGLMCMWWVCVCVRTHTGTHTLHMKHSDVSPGVGMGHLESRKKMRYEKLWQTCTLKWRFSRTRRFSRTTRKEKHVLSIDNFFCWLSLYPSSLQQRFAPATVNRKRIRDPIKTNKTNNKFVPCDFLRIDECHWITHFSFLF